MIRRRSAIEPAIGHMKTDGKLDRNWPKGALGDALHATPVQQFGVFFHEQVQRAVQALGCP